MIYKFTYVREQRVYIDVEATNNIEATRLAWEQASKLSLDSRDDESDDGGAIWLDEIVVE